MILHPLLIAYDGIAEGVTEYLFLVSLFARKYDEKAFLTSSLIGWGVLLDRVEGLGLSGGGSLTAAFFEDSLLIAGARKLPVHAWQQDLFLHRK